MATMIMASLTEVSSSLSRHSRRYRISHANVRSTTHRRGITTKPFAPLGRLSSSTAQPQNRRAHATSPAYAESAHTSRSDGNRALPPRSSALAPARSLTSAAVTSTASSSPVLSTSTCRLRPATFFPPVVAAGAGQRGALDRLAVHRPGGRLGRAAVADAAVVAQRVVEAPPGAVPLPAAEVAVDGVPGREVARQHAPGAAGAQQVEDGVEDVAAVVLGGPAAGPRGGDQGGDVGPLHVRQVGRVVLPAHGPILRRRTATNRLFQQALSINPLGFSRRHGYPVSSASGSDASDRPHTGHIPAQHSNRCCISRSTCGT